MELTRRHVLAGAAGIAAAPLLPPISAQAAAPLAEKQAPSFYRYKVGDIQVTAFPTARTPFRSRNLYHQCQEGRGQARSRRPSCRRTCSRIYFTPLVINTGGKLVVLDTGNGALAFATSKGANGQFADQHGRRGLRPEGGRYGGDLALPWRSRQWAAECGWQARRSRTRKFWCRPTSGNSAWTTAR